MDPLDPYVQLIMEAPPSPDYIPRPEAPPSPNYIPGPEAPPSPDYVLGPEYPEYLLPADDVLPAEEQPLPAAVSPTAESPRYITKLEPEMEPEEEDGDDEKYEEDSIEYSTSGGDDDADDDGDDLSDDDADDKDEEESSDSEEEEEEHLALTVLAPALYSSRARFTTPTGGYKVGESSVVAAARQIRPALTIANRRRADDRLMIMDYCQSREVHTTTLVTQIEALQRDVSTLQRQHIEHGQRDVAPEDGDSCS
nr:hypothetical protein [Tanacetum cinerariifolium]